ncbi:hypothetical protein TNCV_4311811 [Trichonephila clavipes]|nr:hypothetical protein TNCV_4311811 [Trichonephila clavipes]
MPAVEVITTIHTCSKANNALQKSYSYQIINHNSGKLLTIHIFCHSYIATRISTPYISVINTAPITSNSLSISAASSSSTACPVLETSSATSNTIPTTSQDAKQTSKPRRKKRPPKNPSNTKKPKIEIKIAPHKPGKYDSTLLDNC